MVAVSMVAVTWTRPPYTKLVSNRPGHPAHRQRVGRVGRPQGSRIRAYMESYSPYDNVPAGPRPDLLVTGSLHDPRVLIHEPAKWAARLRATSGTGDRSDGAGGTGAGGAGGGGGTGRLLFRPELGAGAHVGPAGRYDRMRYEAEVLAFIMTSVSLPQR